MLLRTICHQVSNQSDKFDLLWIILLFLPTFRPPIQHHVKMHDVKQKTEASFDKKTPSFVTVKERSKYNNHQG